MDAALRRKSGRASGYPLRVSILVLMDAALRPGVTVMPRAEKLGFNPCFDGCRPATYSRLNQLFSVITFQSLF